MASKLDLISSALVLAGDSPINSLTGPGRAKEVANSLYDDIVKTELTKHRWGFARRKAQLSLLTAEPIDDEWRSIYQLPSDLLVLIKLNPNTNYQILGSKVYTNISQALYCDYIQNVNEGEWPVYFASLVKYALAKDFSISIRDNVKIHALMKEEYKDAGRMARFTDSQQHPQTPIVRRPFIDVRF